MTYTVALAGFPGASPDAIRAAESRCRAALEQSLGDQVVPALKAFQKAIQWGAEQLNEEEIGLAVDWQKTFALADAVGLKGLCNADEAFFKVRPGQRLCAAPRP